MRLSRMRTILSLLAAFVVGVTFAPAPALAAGTAQFNMSVTSARPGEYVMFTQGDPCPAKPEDALDQTVQFTFTDSAGVQMTGGNQTNADGTWRTDYPSGITQLGIKNRTVVPGTNPPTFTQPAAQGVGTMSAQCIVANNDGSSTPVMDYASQPFTVSGEPVQFSMSATSGEPGGTIHISSVEPCPGDRLDLWVTGSQAVSTITLMPGSLNGDGSWAVDAPLSTENMDGTRSPFPAGAYYVHAFCSDEAVFRHTLTYADQLLTVGGTPPPATSCKNVLLVGLAGSGQAFNGEENTSVSPEVQTAIEGFKQKLVAGKTYRVQMLDYPALPVETITKYFPDIHRGLREYIAGKNAGVRQLRTLVTQQMTDCPNQLIVPVGYSQGALVAHEYLVEHAGKYKGAKKQIIGAAVTIADPAQIKGSDVLNFGSAPTNAMGICQYLSVKCFKDRALSDIPDAYTKRTVTVCDRKDVVCDHLRMASTPLPGMGFPEGTAVHKDYGNDPNVELAGKWAAQRVNNRLN